MNRGTHCGQWKDVRYNLGQPIHFMVKETEFEEAPKMKWFGQVSENGSQVLKFYLTDPNSVFFHSTEFPELGSNVPNYRRIKV